ncbi:MAG: DUF1540 domain-containing protein [Firmicutes bacterium]|nr:DUF1540 domain-containing protein [Bacillota bacterium]
MSEIRCQVRECRYNRDRYCDASAIEVVGCGAGSVKCCEQTECRTFQEKHGAMS